MVVGSPAIVDCRSVGTARRDTAEKTKNTAAHAQMSQAVQKKISEQLKILKAGDKDKRIQTIHELAAFTFDNRVRQALEEVLLSDPDPEVRKEVAVSFGRTENRLVLSALTRAKENDTERDVRQAAYRSIIMIKGY
jgi:HEAT repeat protein